MKVIRQLGEGGTSRVYLAFDEKLKEKVTLKFVKEASRQKASEVFKNEIEILKRLGGKGAPRLWEVSEEYIKISYVSGESLLSIIRKNGRLKEKEALGYMADIVKQLRILHERKEPIIYRDLKPANIIIGKDGHARLIDFGAARIYRVDGHIDTVNLGTCGYAAPEQYGSLGQTSPQTDIYCLGMTLLQLVSGTDLKDSERLNEIKKRGLRNVSPETQEIINRCTKPSRKDRYKSCRDIEEALDRIPTKTRHRKVRRYVKIAIIAAIIALMVSVAADHYSQAKEYVKTDVELRVPALRIRLGYAKERLDSIISGIMEEI